MTPSNNPIKLRFWGLSSVALVFLLGCYRVPEAHHTASAETLEKETPQSSYVLVTYFHHNLRCVACQIIEILGRKTVENVFTEDYASGTVRFRIINVDSTENRHFEENYNLKAPSLIIALHINGAERVWKNLERVWDLYEDETAFQNYVADEIRALLTELDAQKENGERRP